MCDPVGGHDFEPEILLLFCQHCAGHDVEPVDSIRKGPGFTARNVVLPCSCKVEIRQLIKLLETGADGIQIVGCPDGSCRFLVGSNRAERRVEYLRRVLEEIHFGPERVGMVRGTDMNGESLLDSAALRAGEVRPLGPNPMKQ